MRVNAFGLVTVAAAVAALGWLTSSPPSEDSARQPASSDGVVGARAAAGGLAAPQARETLGAQRADLFSPRLPASAPPAPPAPAPAAESAPAPLPMPYRAVGWIALGNVMKAVLAKGDAVLEVQEGDLLDGGYRVESIRSERVTLLHVPRGKSEDLVMSEHLPVTAAGPVAAPAAESRRAQMRWHGPSQVQAGDSFDVALKLTSARPVRSLPLQLSYDAKLLEPVSVRAGSFFSAGGNLEYRVSPNGSILVGASGTVGAASDADFIILTFRPILAGATAELSISSVLLRDADGRVVALDRPEAFRAAIIE